MVEVALVVGAIATVAGTGYSIYSGIQAREAEEDAAEIRDRQVALQNRQRRRAQIRESRIRRAQAANIASQTGASESSGIGGGLSSLASQTASNLGYTSQQGALSTLFSGAQQEMRNQQGNAALGQAVAGIGSTLFQFGGGFTGLQNWWANLPTAQAPTTTPIPAVRPAG